MKDDKKLNETFRYVAEITIRLGFLLLLAFWCIRILHPFAGIVIWGVILALALDPFYSTLNRRLGNRTKLSAAIILFVGLIIIFLPSWLFLESLYEGGKYIFENLNKGTLTIPKPEERVASWPLIGGEIYGLWNQASINLADFISTYSEQFRKVAEVVAEGVLDTGISVFQFVISLIIAIVLLIARGTGEFARKFFRRIFGSKGDEYSEIVANTVRNVTKGIIGVALIQALLMGIGFLLAGVPYAGFWALLVFILAILHISPAIIVIPIIIWMFSAFSVLPAVLWTIYLLLAGLSDNVLKPILLAKGASVPMVVIFLGVIGGFLYSGFIGLFTGAIVISLGYKLFIAWINDSEVTQGEITSVNTN